MEIVQILLKPLAFLSMKHAVLNKIRWGIPFVMSFLSIIIAIFLPIKPYFFGINGLIPAVTGLLQILTGFFIASLAAVATFDKKDMDEIMLGTPPTMVKTVDGKKTNDPLTRRRFLCYLFGYLSLLSLFLYFAGSLSPFVSDNVKALMPNKAFLITRYLSLSLYLFLVYQLLTITLLGLYYMAHKIHCNDNIDAIPTAIDSVEEGEE